MLESDEFLISVHNRYASRLLEGTKTIELRRRRPKISPGSRIWIYAKLPTGAIEGFGIVEQIITAKPSAIWRRYKSQAGISKKEFDSYFFGLDEGHAILFKQVMRIKRRVGLEYLRQEVSNFQPPQFFKRLRFRSPELRVLRRRHTQH